MELDSFTWQQSVFLDDELLYTVDPSLDNRIGKVKFSDQYTGIQKGCSILICYILFLFDY